MTIPLARRLDFSEIPVIDIAGTAVIEAIQRARRGRVYLSGRPVAAYFPDRQHSVSSA